MFRYQVRVNEQMLAKMKSGLRKMPKSVRRVADRVAREALEPLRMDIQAMFPPPPEYMPVYGRNGKILYMRRVPPMNWTSDAQRKMYFATGGFGRGIPTTRSGAIENGLTVRKYVSERGLLVTVGNTSPRTPYVIGSPGYEEWQQGFHIDLGWPQPEEIYEVIGFYEEVAEFAITEEIDLIAEELGG